MPTTYNNELHANFPFLTCLSTGNLEYVGIIVNHNVHVTSLYDYGLLTSPEDKRQFMMLGDIWWWESNRRIPIGIFLKDAMLPFRPIIKTFNSKDISVVFGSMVCLCDIAEKRVKRKSIQLIRRQ